MAFLVENAPNSNFNGIYLPKDNGSYVKTLPRGKNITISCLHELSTELENWIISVGNKRVYFGTFEEWMYYSTTHGCWIPADNMRGQILDSVPLQLEQEYNQGEDSASANTSALNVVRTDARARYASHDPGSEQPKVPSLTRSARSFSNLESTTETIESSPRNKCSSVKTSTFASLMTYLRGSPQVNPSPAIRSIPTGSPGSPESGNAETAPAREMVHIRLTSLKVAPDLVVEVPVTLSNTTTVGVHEDESGGAPTVQRGAEEQQSVVLSTNEEVCSRWRGAVDALVAAKEEAERKMREMEARLHEVSQGDSREGASIGATEVHA